MMKRSFEGREGSSWACFSNNVRDSNINPRRGRGRFSRLTVPNFDNTWTLSRNDLLHAVYNSFLSQIFAKNLRKICEKFAKNLRKNHKFVEIFHKYFTKKL